MFTIWRSYCIPIRGTSGEKKEKEKKGVFLRLQYGKILLAVEVSRIGCRVLIIVLSKGGARHKVHAFRSISEIL